MTATLLKHVAVKNDYHWTNISPKPSCVVILTVNGANSEPCLCSEHNSRWICIKECNQSFRANLIEWNLFLWDVAVSWMTRSIVVTLSKSSSVGQFLYLFISRYGCPPNLSGCWCWQLCCSVVVIFFRNILERCTLLWLERLKVSMLSA